MSGGLIARALPFYVNATGSGALIVRLDSPNTDFSATDLVTGGAGTVILDPAATVNPGIATST